MLDVIRSHGAVQKVLMAVMGQGLLHSSRNCWALSAMPEGPSHPVSASPQTFRSGKLALLK